MDVFLLWIFHSTDSGVEIQRLSVQDCLARNRPGGRKDALILPLAFGSRNSREKHGLIALDLAHLGDEIKPLGNDI